MKVNLIPNDLQLYSCVSVQFKVLKKMVLRTDYRTVVSQSTIPSFKYQAETNQKKKNVITADKPHFYLIEIWGSSNTVN